MAARIEPDRGRRTPARARSRTRAARGLRGGRLDRRPLADPHEDLRARDGRPAGLRVGVPRHHRRRLEPRTVLTFRATGDELLALTHAGLPFYKPPWSPTIVGMVLDDDTDWTEVAELVTESYRSCAPQKLVRLLDELGLA